MSPTGYTNAGRTDITMVAFKRLLSLPSSLNMLDSLLTSKGSKLKVDNEGLTEAVSACGVTVMVGTVRKRDGVSADWGVLGGSGVTADCSCATVREAITTDGRVRLLVRRVRLCWRLRFLHNNRHTMTGCKKQGINTPIKSADASPIRSSSAVPLTRNGNIRSRALQKKTKTSAALIRRLVKNGERCELNVQTY